MREKLQKLMTSEGLTQSNLAALLSTQPSNISHILSGRSNPSFDLLRKILDRFPRLNPDWLLLDREPMYRPDFDPQEKTPRRIPEEVSLFDDTGNGTPETRPIVEAEEPAAGRPAAKEATLQPTREAAVQRVIIVYTDGTFESFAPNRAL